jgi:hypothetical protein
MPTQDEDEVNEQQLLELLDTLTSFEREHRLGRRFNVFEAVNMATQEIRHSRFLAFLLDPGETHGLGDAFLRAFLSAAVADLPDKSLTRLDVAIGDLNGAMVHCERDRFDLAIDIPRMQVLLVVENKIGAAESEEQLARYRQLAEQRYPSLKFVGCFLTSEGYEGADARWSRLSYRTVATEMREVLAHAGAPRDVEMVVEHYIQLIERRIVPSSKIIEACKQIYRNHKAAFDLIVTHGQTSTLAAAFEMFVDGVRLVDGQQEPDVRSENVRADAVYFVFKVWQVPMSATLPEAAKGSWPSKYPVLLSFQLIENTLKLRLELGPYKLRKEERAGFLAELSEQLKGRLPADSVKKGRGQEFTLLLAKPGRVAEALSANELVEEMGKLWHSFKPAEVRDAVLAAIQQQPRPSQTAAPEVG